MISVSDFRARCLVDTPESIVDQVLLADDALHVTAENRAYVSERLATRFGIEASSIQLWIVGSAKLGFSISEKMKDGRVLPRYRPFSPGSDIDMAIVSAELFRMIWDDLSVFAHGIPWMPWNSGQLGDYMVYGWLRPDHFPGGGQVRRCDDWWDEFRTLSSSPRFARHSVRGALYHSVSDLRRYQRRSVAACVNFEQERAR